MRNETSETIGFCQECATEIEPCTECGESHPHMVTDLLDHEVNLCPYCATQMILCDKCGNLVHISDTHNVQVTRTQTARWCDDCCDEYSNICEHCGERSCAERSIYSESDACYYCQSCRDHGHLYRCDECGDYVRYNYHSDAHWLLCDGCASDYYRCESCDCFVRIEDVYESNASYYCSECYDNNRQSGDFVHPYGHKPWTIFHDHRRVCSHTALRNCVYYGIELETDKFESLRGASQDVHDLDEDETHVYQKDDGSLDDGIELVFHPRTIESWLHFKKGPDCSLKTITKAISNNGGLSFHAGTCGVHVHRSRADLTDLDLTRLIVAMLKFERQIVKIAQRRSHDYASFTAYKDSNERHTVIYKRVKDKEYENGSRYVALNLCNEKTIEFRVFKGTLNIDTIMAYVTFCDALTNWAKGKSITKLIKTDATTLWKSFIDSIRKGVLYDDLRGYLVRKSLWID